MLGSLGKFVAACADLVEAEGRLLRQHAVRVGVALGVIAVATLAVAAGVGLLIAALFLALAGPLGPAWSALICGGALLLAGVIAIWIAARISS